MPKGLKNIIHNCKQATLLSLKKEEQQLSFKEHFQLGIHLLFCDACKQFIKQSQLINKAVRGLFQQGPVKPQLTAASKEEMNRKLNELK